MIAFLLLILVLIAISARIKTNKEIEVYKLALENAVAYHNYIGYINSSIGFKRHYDKTPEQFIEDARSENQK
jgi:uncharacterized membrane protein